MEPYVQRIGESLYRVLDRARRAQPEAFAAFVANLEFWVEEFEHLRQVAESSTERRKRNKEARRAYVAEHGAAEGNGDRKDRRTHGGHCRLTDVVRSCRLTLEVTVHVATRLHLLDRPRRDALLDRVFQNAPTWERVHDYVQRLWPPDSSSYLDLLRVLEHHPPGYARAFSMWFSGADIDNGGFIQYFSNSTGQLVLKAIECFERLGQDRMALILKSALWAYRLRYPDELQISIREGYFNAFAPIANELEELSDMFYAEKRNLPGKTDGSSYLDDVVEYYVEHYPEDFRNQTD